MKKLLTTLAVVAFSAAAAQAQTAASRWFLSTDGLSDGGNVNSPAVAPANLAGLSNPTLDTTVSTRLYLWLNVTTGGRIWNGFQNYQVEVRGGTATATVTIYNLPMVVDFGDDGAPGGGDDVTQNRWASTNNGSGQGSQNVTGITMFTVGGIGARNTALPLGGDPHFINPAGNANDAILLGQIDFSAGGTGSVYIHHALASAATATGGVATANTFVRLGFGDEGEVFSGGSGGKTSIAEATLTPEPASLALLGLAALALRRR
ncbi:hypothetical protein RAS1_00110 [Phycisphaerae bacterium RAS1]|nr:hypothetical protein RAS1_00110 [Phycisphaerae bacterium RAS1]